MYYRSKDCKLILSDGDVCSDCTIIQKYENKSANKKKACEPAKLKAPIIVTSPERIKLTLKMHCEENKVLLTKITQLQSELEKASMPISEDLHSDFRKLFSEKQKRPTIYETLLARTAKIFKFFKNRYSLPPNGLNLAAKSPSVYEEIRYDESQGTVFFILPSRRRLRDYKHYITPLEHKTRVFSSVEQSVILTFDEMKIQDSLV